MGKITVISRHPEVSVNTNSVVAYAENAINQMQLPVKELTVVFVDNATIQQLHAQYLNDDSPTDIITFPLNEPDDPIEADIIISLDVADENARFFKVPVEEELRRLILHGLLHLSGLRDKTDEEQQVMRNQENYWLKTLPEGAPFLKNPSGK